jgi:preprotein translocase subunit SecF
MQLFKDVNIDWMKLKWYFITVSLIFFIIGWASVLKRGGLIYSIDFTGGTLIKIKLAQKPNLDALRPVLKNKLGASDVTRFDIEEKNEIQVRLKKVESEEKLTFQKLGEVVNNTLSEYFDKDKSAGKQDLNRVGVDQLAAALRQSRVLENMGRLKADAGIEETNTAYKQLATSIVDYRNENGGLIGSVDALTSASGIPVPVQNFLKQNFYLGSFTVLSIDSVGPKIGKELRDKASKAVIFSLLGMLVYVALRFRIGYGVGAVMALFHDVLITVGLVTFFQKEISLTVVAAFLTLVGYSINDTIVVFDRIRENLKLARNMPFGQIISLSINQTLSRTIITSGLTFISVLCLWILGGETLDAFSFVLVIGIIIGTYSSIAIASPITFYWMKYLGTAKDKKVLKFA